MADGLFEAKDETKVETLMLALLDKECEGEVVAVRQSVGEPEAGSEAETDSEPVSLGEPEMEGDSEAVEERQSVGEGEGESVVVKEGLGEAVNVTTPEVA